MTAINAEAAQGGTGKPPDAGIGGTLATDVTDPSTYSLTIKRPRSGTTIEIADSMNPDDADPATPQFAQMEEDLGEANGFTRTMHVRVNSDTSDEEDGSKVEEVVIVATDIAPPTETPFATVHPLDGS